MTGPAPSHEPSQGPSYDERLVAPWWWWLLGVGLALMAAFQVHAGGSGARAVVPYVVFPVTVVVLLAVVSRQRLRVRDGQLLVPGARAPLTAFGAPEVLDRTELRLWLGARAHRDAWVAVRPWLGGAVRLPVVDPGDDTPYWLVGSRHPERLAARLGGS